MLKHYGCLSLCTCDTHSALCLSYTAEATIEVSATTARFTWPLVSSSQTSVPGYIIDVQAIEPVGIDQAETASTAPQENTESFTNLEEGVRYRFCLFTLPPTPVGSAIINQHKGEFTTDSAGRNIQLVVANTVHSNKYNMNKVFHYIAYTNPAMFHLYITYLPWNHHIRIIH